MIPITVTLPGSYHVRVEFSKDSSLYPIMLKQQRTRSQTKNNSAPPFRHGLPSEPTPPLEGFQYDTASDGDR